VTFSPHFAPVPPAPFDGKANNPEHSEYAARCWRVQQPAASGTPHSGRTLTADHFRSDPRGGANNYTKLTHISNRGQTANALVSLDFIEATSNASRKDLLQIFWNF
jgi:hypothetical protein